MQTIEHRLYNIHPIFNEFDRLYAVLSEKKEKDTLIKHTFSSALKPLISLFNSYFIREDIKTQRRKIHRLKPIENNDIIVCFSGGKDSIATVLHYIEAGYNVYLYHMRKINPPLFDEYIQAQEIAKYLNLPIYIDEIKLSGKHDYIEHPMKNMIIANGALQYGIRNSITTNIAFGNYKTSSLEYDNFEYCGGDDIEMWEIYNKIISKVIPGFKMNIALEHLGETLETVCPNKELLNMSISCLGRASMREYWHNRICDKYGIEIPKHRCGRCYKCCIEYIYMADHDLTRYNEEYYRYCFNNLRKNVEREDGFKYEQKQVWNHYFFYDIEKSKYFKRTLDFS